MTSFDIQKKLAHYINFHSHPHSAIYNTIEGIVASENTRENIEAVMKLLKKNYAFVDYNKDKDVNIFLKELSDVLNQRKTIFISTQTLNFDPIIYDQLIHIRDYNSLDIKLINSSSDNLIAKTIPDETNIFLIYQKNDNQKLEEELYAITDHILDLRKEN